LRRIYLFLLFVWFLAWFCFLHARSSFFVEQALIFVSEKTMGSTTGRVRAFSVPDRQSKRQATAKQHQLAMDQEKWMASTIGATGGRTAFDLAQAKSMKGSSKEKPTSAGSSAFAVMIDDYESGMRGLQKAVQYRKKGDMLAAKKIYLLSIDLLMEVFKARKEESGEQNQDVQKLHQNIQKALTEAEEVQASLSLSSAAAASSSPSSMASKSFEDISA
jgi:hypothetical protein